MQNPIPSPPRTQEQPVRQVGMGRRFETIWLLTTFVVLSALAFLFPANGDDWAWGSSIGAERLHTLFADYNGRYVANLVVLALTRVPLIAPLVVGAGLTALIFLIVDLSRNRTVWGYAITTALLLAMPLTMWRETVSWLSGFTNYTLSTLLVLVYLRAVQRDWRREQPPAHRVLRMIGIIVLAFLAAQFMENVTLYFVVASLVVLVAQLIRRRVSLDAWGWVIGFLLGAAMMFSNGAYGRALPGGAAGGGQYQQVGGTESIMTKLLEQVSRRGVVDNVALNIVLAGAVILLAVIVARRGGVRRAIAPLVLIVLFLITVVPLSVLLPDTALTLVPSGWGTFAGLGALLLLAALVTIAFSLTGERRLLFAAGLGTVLILVAPLAVVSPLGPRLFLATYCVILVLVNVLFQEAAGGLGPVSLSGLAAVAGAAAIGLLAGYFVVYSIITVAATHRLEAARAAAAAGKSSVMLRPLPFADYVHHADPTPGTVWEDRYKLYYDLPPGLTITLSK
ncbi:hypothetical protein LK09_02150 [Microbacterium mangrovi]|uniref:Glucosyltransferase GtrII-like protein n=1 Tax=Microbacterium mangrovi TaxID=1348253 RepID=A0A0B2ACV1_9MICO|nr:DUF6056 family protein [Microbacterium mangrovi]KHK99471.1 hypothetical protein LK09_02150 [Microbacterium mangrovi]